MSTCPSKDLYSAYVDGELQSPWKEKIEAHLASCEKCSSVVDSYRKISLKLSEVSCSEPDFEGSFLKLYAKRQECLKRIEENKKKPTSWFYKSNKIPVPALAAAAVFLFVLTPVVMISTGKNLKPSDSIAGKDFKSTAPIVSDLKPVNKFKLNVSNILGVNEKAIVFKNKTQAINLSQYVNLYLPPSNKTKFSILEKKINTQVLFFKDHNAITLTSIENGK
ncbi:MULTISPECIES: anti-sigma factor [unclassified Treponema]|uniref:anti-sigma factor family protein n=1 Tax=unclassified Treponema TaxID=2638727 RepID=UPI0020A52EA1|nr:MULTISPECIES: zf-HC2 domain-containing protein [unclassified Treponema]UTC66619.1 zf-HC2 domain-containing protein [Treponema sp. OMZ 789]UTC69351.1 zf-HC2 domain-containing protein [Treponema sp. OMZ 790]UTC72066.1 zf-HC2 domain-containing protein [Treponema sp. OMZ 791]